MEKICALENDFSLGISGDYLLNRGTSIEISHGSLVYVQKNPFSSQVIVKLTCPFSVETLSYGVMQINVSWENHLCDESLFVPSYLKGISVLRMERNDHARKLSYDPRRAFQERMIFSS